MKDLVGGGYPLAAVLGRRDILSVFDQASVKAATFVNQVGTLNGNPIACAAGLATMAELRKEGTYEGLRETGSKVRKALVDICAQNGVAVQMCGEDVIFDVFFTDRPVFNYRDGLAGDAGMMTRFNTGLLERGVLKGAIKFYPSVVHTEEDVERTIQAFKEVVPTRKNNLPEHLMRTLKKLFTAEELLHLPTTGRRLELVKGKVYEMSPAGGRHGSVAMRLGTSLSPYVRINELGEVFAAETGFILRRDPDTVRAPDVSFVAKDRLPMGELPAGYMDVVPDLAVEVVVSPSDRESEVLDKVEEWLQAGTRRFWFIRPETRSATVYSSLEEVQDLSEADSLDGAQVIPGFTCNIRDLFS